MGYDLDIKNKGIYLHVRIEGVQCLGNFIGQPFLNLRFLDDQDPTRSAGTPPGFHGTARR